MDSNTLIGIACGLGAALCASLSYLSSRRFVMKEGRSPTQLLALSHLQMALGSLALLPLFYRAPVSSWWQVGLGALGVSGFYFLGQGGLFHVLRRASASNISPLLGLKIAIAALFWLLAGNNLALLQWMAILLTLLATLLLRNSCEGISLRLIAAVILICCFYTGSDYSIRYLVLCIGKDPGFQDIGLAVVLSYILCGLFSLVFSGEIRRSTRSDWLVAFGFALPWYAGMFCLFGAFALVGVVYGGILQSLRGIISVLLAIILTAAGQHFAGEKTSKKTRVRQLAAATLMVAAVILYRQETL